MYSKYIQKQNSKTDLMYTKLFNDYFSTVLHNFEKVILHNVLQLESEEFICSIELYINGKIIFANIVAFFNSYGEIDFKPHYKLTEYWR